MKKTILTMLIASLFITSAAPVMAAPSWLNSLGSNAWSLTKGTAKVGGYVIGSAAALFCVYHLGRFAAKCFTKTVNGTKNLVHQTSAVIKRATVDNGPADQADKLIESRNPLLLNPHDYNEEDAHKVEQSSGFRFHDLIKLCPTGRDVWEFYTTSDFQRRFKQALPKFRIFDPETGSVVRYERESDLVNNIPFLRGLIFTIKCERDACIKDRNKLQQATMIHNAYSEACAAAGFDFNDETAMETHQPQCINPDKMTAFYTFFNEKIAAQKHNEDQAQAESQKTRSGKVATKIGLTALSQTFEIYTAQDALRFMEMHNQAERLTVLMANIEDAQAQAKKKHDEDARARAAKLAEEAAKKAKSAAASRIPVRTPARRTAASH